MGNYRLRSSDFLVGAYSAAQLAESEIPEIAFLGRSNVGKSSLLNRLTERKALARTSSTPGRTQQINIFSVDALTPKDEVLEFTIADLPGYGYAKFSKARREAMSRMIVDYIITRQNLKVVCLLNDSKRLPEEDELAIRDLCFENEIPIIVCATKCDRLKKNDLQKKLKSIAEAYGLQRDDIVTTGEKTSIGSLWKRLDPFIYPS